MSSKTLYDKIWDSHVVKQNEDDTCLIYIDRHLVQEVSTPVSFASLKQRGAKLRQPAKALAMVDHVLPTTIPSSNNRQHIADPQAKAMLIALENNVEDTGMPYISVNDKRQGILHIVGPEQGFTLPGTTLVCGDSHTATHGAFGSLAFGIGASECEKVFATQCLNQVKAKTMRITFSGELPLHVTAKDMALATIAKLGVSGGTGYAIEYAGDVIRKMSMEARMTLCNMTIEAGARVGMVAPDEVTFNYLQNRPMAPKGDLWDQAVNYWLTLPSDSDAIFDAEIEIDIDNLEPYVSWGTSPEHTISISHKIPQLADAKDDSTEASWRKALDYMDIKANAEIKGLKINKVFIGSCTNSRIEDLRAAAKVIIGKSVAENVLAIVVPGSGEVKAHAEAEGLDQIFMGAGFEWRAAGCSMCVAMNNDRLKPGERCASTSNRNFEGRQGVGGRTHLMSPAMAAAAAITGEITDVRELI
ncbi:3-isopropylmalate dehydratase large subunit [Aliiglaciecola sp. 2_MG-2023]|uniref:3-isopropylmalate dehydratase large subunit n=1 Tax=unclassified Aliiglaciecola TaxID=2593648 RepID=UPI0026E22927|nr:MULTISPECIES: 3-isopropylmalate dehydratase large subunit [unclassified Aliiglaciecola]MDO6711727.1 3-isopropylmalate dehydratase large subunit [Aliiglaciecola sp. 2_MG-2023]MDO6752798.1 3-isopropylmalate dehydratase large subunit [Aliiglaciecola sp. 1_MG-2023]